MASVNRHWEDNLSEPTSPIFPTKMIEKLKKTLSTV